MPVSLRDHGVSHPHSPRMIWPPVRDRDQPTGWLIRLVGVTLSRLLAAQAAGNGERVAIAYPDTSLTFTELYAKARALARAMLADGLRRGDRVGIFMPNSLEYIQLIFAASLAGAQLVPINARFKRRELGYVLANSEISILFTSAAIADHVNFPGLVLDVLDEAPLPALRRVVIAGAADDERMLGLADFVALGGSDEELDAVEHACSTDDVAVVLYT